MLLSCPFYLALCIVGSFFPPLHPIETHTSEARKKQMQLWNWRCTYKFPEFPSFYHHDSSFFFFFFRYSAPFANCYHATRLVITNMKQLKEMGLTTGLVP